MDRNFYNQQSSGLNQQAVSFQSSVKDEQYEMSMMEDLGRMSRTGSMSFAGNSGNVNCGSGFTEIGKSCDSFVVGTVPELRHRPGLAAEWSVEEEYKLEEALAKYGFCSSFIFFWFLFYLMLFVLS